MVRFWVILTIVSALSMGGQVRAESQSTDYKGVADPFGDPANYEFAEDEREDKEFFHLGRYLMLGVDFGTGIFTSGLGQTTSPAFYVGAKIVYFFDKQLAFEGGFHYGRHENTMQPTTTKALKLDTIIIPITLGMRYYFDTKNAPKAIAVANPYLAAGGGIYMRSESVLVSNNFPYNQGQSATTNNYGVYFGGGTEFNIYRKHIYLGLDFRYHFIFFNDEESTLNNNLPVGGRSGDYFTGGLSLTYNF